MKTMTKSQIMTSIKKSSKTISGVTSGIFALFVIAVIALLIAAVAIPYGSSMTDLYSGKLGITYNNNAPRLVGNATAFCICGMTEIAVLAAMAASVSKMFRSISSNGKPFTETTNKYIKKISVLCLINAFVPNLIMIIANLIFGTAEKISYEADLGYIAMALLLITVGKIVSYGIMLQRESDETL